MITKSYIKLNILFYYASYGLKGLGLYLILYFISESETFCGLPSYLYYNSVFLILVPLLSIGVGSYLLRYSYSERQQKRVLTSFFIFVVAEILVALVISVFSLEYSIVVIWASLRSSFIAFEAYLISNKKYWKISLVYLIQFLGISVICLLAFLDKINNFYILILLLLCLDTISLPFLIKSFSFTNLWMTLRSARIFNRYYRFMLPIVMLSLLMALFINMDRVFIAEAGYEKVLEVYGYLLLYILAIHRFFTTPFIMRFAAIYYQDVEDKISNKYILKGTALILSGSLLLSTAFYYFQPEKFNLKYFSAFTLFVIALYFINLQMLYLKKKLHMDTLVKVFIKITLSTASVWVGYLFFFGANNLQVVIVINSVIALAFLFRVTKSVDVQYFYYFSLASIGFIGVNV